MSNFYIYTKWETRKHPLYYYFKFENFFARKCTFNNALLVTVYVLSPPTVWWYKKSKHKVEKVSLPQYLTLEKHHRRRLANITK